MTKYIQGKNWDFYKKKKGQNWDLGQDDSAALEKNQSFVLSLARARH